jgi:heat-inducible transcriptional repressor
MGTKPEDNLSGRARQLLKTLVETHIHEGEPVGSRTLARVSGLDVSPATIRNIMAELEEMGLITSPHTSAGRIPTEAGYRLFVDSLLQVEPLDERVVQRFRQQFSQAGNTQSLVQSASKLLSSITQLAGVVTLPKRVSAVIQQVEFMPLSGHRVLAVLVLGNDMVQNRILQLERDFSRSELEQAANFLTAHFAGMEIEVARRQLEQELQTMRSDLNELMASVILLGEQTFNSEQQSDEEGFVLAGETHLMDYRELSDMEKLRSLFEAFNRKRDILHLLDRCVSAEGVQIFVGHESGYSVLDDCSVVSAPYSHDGRIIGVLGVIGPTRMAYDKVIPIVDLTARLLGSALNSR